MSKVFEARFAVNKDKAAQIAERLYDQFYGGKGFFEGYRMPEYILPRNLVPGSKEHAQYLTFVISIDYMTDAVKLWRNAGGTYELYPERFSPSEILAMADSTLRTFVRRLGA